MPAPCPTALRRPAAGPWTLLLALSLAAAATGCGGEPSDTGVSIPSDTSAATESDAADIQAQGDAVPNDTNPGDAAEGDTAQRSRQGSDGGGHRVADHSDPIIPQDGCPATTPQEGAACTPLNNGVSWCEHGTEACPVRCTCSWDGSHPDPVWHCILPVGPLCPANDCPQAAPDNQSTCSEPDPVAPYFTGHGCSYSGCDCDCWHGAWQCQDNCTACPETAPEQGASCPASAEFAACQYGPANQCSGQTCLCDTPLIPGATPVWDCWASCDAACPSPPPTTGDACDAAQVKDLCLYTTPPMCGTCQCGKDGTWFCTESSCDQCPAKQPSDGDPCAPANEHCGYGDDICECTGDGGTAWVCH